MAGGLITFTPPSSGASATLAGSPATIGANGTASVTATANGIDGSYAVTATASGITTPASFSLTNLVTPTFSGLTSPTIVYGTSTTTLTGHLGAGTAYPAGSSVSITLNSVVQTATVDGSGDFTTTFSTASLGVAGGPYTVTYAFAGSPGFNPATDTSTSLAVTPAPLTVSAVSTSMTYGTAVPALTYTYTGLVNKEASATFTGALATTATSSSPVGLYPITQGTLTATGNYTIGTFNPGTLTVTWNPSTPASVYVLDPKAGGALTLAGSAGINVPGNVIVDSSSSSALTISGVPRSRPAPSRSSAAS